MAGVAAPERNGRGPGVPWLVRHPFAVAVGMVALTVMFGLQAIRVAVPGLTWILGDRFDLGAVELGGIALLAFGVAFLAGVVRRWLGGVRAVVVTGGGLGLARLVMQLWWGEPLLNLVLALLGTALFALFLPLALHACSRRGLPALGHFALGLLAGLLLDTVVHGALLTYDLAWRPEPAMLAVTLGLLLVQWLLVGGWAASGSSGSAPSAGIAGVRVLPWLAIGPFLFLELVVLQNIGRLAVLTGWRFPLAYAGVVLAQLVAIAAAVWLLSRERRSVWLVGLVCGAALVAVSFVAEPENEWLAVIALLLGQVSISLLMTMVAVAAGREGTGGGMFALVLVSGLGMVLLVALLLGYYVGYQIELPYDNALLEIAAAVLAALCGIAAALAWPGGLSVARGRGFAGGLAAAALVPVLVLALLWQQPVAEGGSGLPVRAMTYNLHNGFNAAGHLDMEALADVIEESRPDIVALQEVSRGWLVSGRVDMLTWLSRRLDMPYVSGPTAGPLWGNAILSRYPIVAYENHDLPPGDLLIPRGLISATLDLGNGQTLRVIATHFHHGEDGSQVRQVQASDLVSFWGGTGGTIVLGDLNAEPDTPEVQRLRDAGLVDAAAEAGATDNTFDSLSPHERIDYVWVSPDLSVRDVIVPLTTASDHLPVVAVVGR